MTIFSVVDALTRISGNLSYIGDRTDLDVKASRLIALATSCAHTKVETRGSPPVLNLHRHDFRSAPSKPRHQKIENVLDAQTPVAVKVCIGVTGKPS